MKAEFKTVIQKLSLRPPLISSEQADKHMQAYGSRQAVMMTAQGGPCLLQWPLRAVP